MALPTTHVEAPSGSNLSKTALEVFPHLKRTYEELRKFRQELFENENLIKLGNKIIREEASDSEVIDFRMILAKAKSKILLEPGLDERGKLIRTNFIDKLEKSVLIKGEVIEEGEELEPVA